MMDNPIRVDIGTFDASLPIEKAVTPPSAWYCSPKILHHEYQSVFRSHWLAVGHSAQVVEHGAYFTGEIADEPVLVVRGIDGILRGFYNVCRHHAACVADDRGMAESFTCPYHGWRYGLDGRLLKAPYLGAIENFDPKEFGLKSISVCEWQGVVFVHFGQPSHEPAALWPELDRRLNALNTQSLQFVERRTYELDCNWKVFCDNYLDGGYHVGVLHPDLAQSLDLDSYETEVFDGYSIQSSAAADEAGARLGDGALYAFVGPNLMMNRYGPILDINVVFPTGPETCTVVFDFFFSPESVKDHQFVSESLAKSEQVQKEDMLICRSVQRGLRSSAYDTGRYAPKLEHGMYAFHQWLAAQFSKYGGDTCE